MTATTTLSKTAVRLPNLGKLWRGSKIRLRPTPEISARLFDDLPEPGRISADDIPTERMVNKSDLSTRIMRNPNMVDNAATRQPSQEELDFFTHKIPPGMRKISALQKQAIRIKMPKLRGIFSGIGDLSRKARDWAGPSLGKAKDWTFDNASRAGRWMKDYATDPLGRKMRMRGLDQLTDPAGGAAEVASGNALMRGARRRMLGTGAGLTGAGLGTAYALSGDEPGGGGGAGPAEAAQARLKQRMSSPYGGLLDDLTNPETEEMAAARRAKLEELGDKATLMERWQLMDPNMRYLLLALLLGGGITLGGAMLS